MRYTVHLISDKIGEILDNKSFFGMNGHFDNLVFTSANNTFTLERAISTSETSDKQYRTNILIDFCVVS